MSIRTINVSSVIYIFLLHTTSYPMAQTAATFGATALSIATARTAIKLALSTASDIGADPRELAIFKSRTISTRLGSIRLHVRKCISRTVLTYLALSLAKKTGSIIAPETQTVLYAVAVGSSMLVGG